ncbi:hypothetical protein [Neptuniibacter sp. QD37_11]|uniref:hypothetical protein n=1 Tax=Neptuniibacter sp. QD37_11 TaxID=3398209 RepID=UPI0039F48AEA
MVKLLQAPFRFIGLTLLMLTMSNTAMARDSLVTTCNWFGHGYSVLIQKTNVLVPHTTIPKDCVTLDAIDAVIREFQDKGEGKRVRYDRLIAAANPPACPEGYETYGEITGEVIRAEPGITFTARRLCLYDE